MPDSLHQFSQSFLHQSVSQKAQTNLPSDGVLVYTERDIFSLRLVPFHKQIQALVQDERVEEASLLLDGVQARCPLDLHKVKCNFHVCISNVKIPNVKFL